MNTPKSRQRGRCISLIPCKFPVCYPCHPCASEPAPASPFIFCQIEQHKTMEPTFHPASEFASIFLSRISCFTSVALSAPRLPDSPAQWLTPLRTMFPPSPQHVESHMRSHTKPHACKHACAPVLHAADARQCRLAHVVLQLAARHGLQLCLQRLLLHGVQLKSLQALCRTHTQGAGSSRASFAARP